MKQEIDSVSIVLDLTRACNFECEHCMMSASRRMSTKYLSNEDLDKIEAFVEFCEDRVECISTVLVGGEPTLKIKEFRRVINHVMTWNTSMGCTSNGWWLRSASSCGAVLDALREYFNRDGTLRISNSPHHSRFRTDKEKEIIAAGLSALAESTHEFYPSLERYNEELQDYEATKYFPATVLYDAIQEELVHIEKQEAFKNVPVGRAYLLGNFDGDARYHSCGVSDAKFVFSPGAICSGVCCSGGHVNLGKLGEVSHEFLWEHRNGFVKEVMRRHGDSDGGMKCRECVRIREQYFREHGIAGRPKDPQMKMQEVLQ